LTVIAGARRDDAARALRWRQTGDPVVSSAQLEAEDRLEILALEEDFVIEPAREPRRRVERRLACHLIHTAGQNVAEERVNMLLLAVHNTATTEDKYVKIGENQEWDEKQKKNVKKDVMGYRKEPVTVHVIEGRVQGAAQVEVGGAIRRDDVSFTYAGRDKRLYNFPDEVRTIAGLRDYLVAHLADKAVAVATFGPDPVEALLATDGDLKPGNKFTEAGLFKEALDEWSRRTFKGDKEAARLHNIGVATEALAYTLAPFAPEHLAQLQQARELYKRAFMMDPGEKYFADPLKRIDVSLESRSCLINTGAA
jgi:hypothetical protein